MGAVCCVRGLSFSFYYVEMRAVIIGAWFSLPKKFMGPCAAFCLGWLPPGDVSHACIIDNGYAALTSLPGPNLINALGRIVNVSIVSHFIVKRQADQLPSDDR